MSPSETASSVRPHWMDARRGRTSRPLSLAVAILLLASHNALAGYLIDPTGGTVLFDSTVPHDDETVTRPIGFTGQFFGNSYSSVDVSTNGNLNFSGFQGYTNYSLGNSPAMIAPLWNDLQIYQGSGQKIVEKAVAGQYYSVTWDIASFQNSAARYQFQAVLFSGSSLIGGTAFLPNDIAFAYQRIDPFFASGNATVGLSDGTGEYATLSSLLPDGVLTAADTSLLPTGANQFLLARWDGSGYTASVATVPEPSTWALGVLGIVCGALRFRCRSVPKRMLALMAISGCLVLAAEPNEHAHAGTVFDTSPSWSGSSISAFGVSTTTTYGQTFVAPTDNVLQRFSFSLKPRNGATLSMRAYVSEWTGSLLGGGGGGAVGDPLFVSDSSIVIQDNGGYQSVTVPTNGTILTPQGHYVAFLTVSNPSDYSASSGVSDWAIIRGSRAANSGGGGFVFFNNGAASNLLHSQRWDNHSDFGDLAWRAEFTAVPEPSTWGLGITGLICFGVFSRRRRRVHFGSASAASSCQQIIAVV